VSRRKSGREHPVAQRKWPEKSFRRAFQSHHHHHPHGRGTTTISGLGTAAPIFLCREPGASARVNKQGKEFYGPRRGGERRRRYGGRRRCRGLPPCLAGTPPPSRSFHFHCLLTHLPFLAPHSLPLPPTFSQSPRPPAQARRRRIRAGGFRPPNPWRGRLGSPSRSSPPCQVPPPLEITYRSRTRPLRRQSPRPALLSSRHRGWFLQ
jgi:hypothetical protein